MRFFEGFANTAKQLHELAKRALGMATRAGSHSGRLMTTRADGKRRNRPFQAGFEFRLAPTPCQKGFLYPSGDAGVAQRQSSCFVNRWSASEIEIGPKGPYDQLFKNN
jgi:hypothetical protein